MPSPDEVRAIGLALEARRLSPVAAFEAVEGLLAIVRGESVAAPGVVWALGKSFDPRIVPALNELLARVVDEPAHDLLIAQIASVLGLFLDERAMAGMRLVAARGRGDAREIAAGWLATRALPADAPRRHAPVRVSPIGGAVSRLQRRPGTAQLVLTDGASVRVVEPSGAEVVSVAVAPHRTELAAWCLSGDGRCVALFARDGSGSLIDLVAGTAAPLRAPDALPVDNLRPHWPRAEELVLCGGTSTSAFYRLNATRDGFEPLSSLEARKTYRTWTKSLDFLSIAFSRLLRVEPDEHRMIAYDFQTPPGALVILRDDVVAKTEIPAPRFIPELATDGTRLFALYEHEVHALDATGAVTDVYVAPEGTFLRGLDLLDEHTLVVAATGADGRSSLVTFAI